MLKKTRILILAAVTMVVMLLGSTGVFADDTLQAVPITKKVTMAEGVQFDSTTFTFVAKQVNNMDGITSPLSVSAITTSATMSSSELSNGSFQTGNIDFSGLTKAGEYSFVLEETAPADKDTATYGWTKSTDLFLIRAYVKNPGEGQTGLQSEYTVVKLKESSTATKDFITYNEKKYIADGTKNVGPEFTNEYTETGATLDVSKTVTGDYADKGKEFQFTITFETVEPNTPSMLADIKADKNDGSTSIELADNAYTFTLKTGETMHFTGIPAGTKYKVKENSTTAYPLTDFTPSVSVNGQAATKGELATELETTPTVIKDTGDNTAAFTNAYKDISPTGIITHYLPYIAIILLAIGAFVFFVASRRRRAVRY